MTGFTSPTSHRSIPGAVGAVAVEPLWSGFVRSLERFPERPALLVERSTASYAELGDRALRIAATIQSYPEFADPALTGVFAYRSLTAFAGVLGALLAGNGYVPLNRTFPGRRTSTMVDRSSCRTLIVDQGSLPQLDEVLENNERSLLIILPDAGDTNELRIRWPRHTILGANDLEPASRWCTPEVDKESIAYLLFTSGSTGVPKGVMVPHRSVAAFLQFVSGKYHITENDRLSQTFDLTFDLSVFDMFVAWGSGACVCCPSQKALMNPSRFIRDANLTVWFSVPSSGVFMKRLGALKPGAFPGLRLSLFCGEPLPVAVAAAWAEAAPNAEVENLYGPTELTIAATRYRWDPTRTPAEAEMGIVPIGKPFPGMSVLVVDPELHEVAPGEDGELLMAGPQMTLGYLEDPAKTAEAFVTPPGFTQQYYRTGDRVRRPRSSGPLTHLGRMDSQIKIRGHRVELGEIEATIREASGVDGVVAVPWPVTENGYEGIEMFIQGAQLDVEALRGACASTLPDYMVPRRFHFVNSLPLNPNGKFDRKVLEEWLKG